VEESAKQDNIYILPMQESVEPEHTSAHHLHTQLTPLIGREQEVAAVCTILRRSEVRILTLIGVGGVGKTRLALKVAITLVENFADGVYFVPLAPISDPELVIPTIAQALGVTEGAERSSLDLLKIFLQDKDLLLLLDNFEQILPAAPHLTDLLVSCPDLKVLVTSRAVLHVQGEHEFPVPPLALPDLTQLSEPETLSQYAAIGLFLQRAQAVKPTFQITAANARAIAEICVHLDGLPLAIELAAARIKLLPPQALLTRLGHRLDILTSGTQDVPARQQTLRNTITWSYQLLDAQEQRLFRWLSTFVGGCSLQAVEAVVAVHDKGNEAIWMLDGVASLIDKSLLQQVEQEGEEPRLVMLETIREYGLGVLAASGEMEDSRQAHASYYLALAEEAEPQLRGAEQARWVSQLEREQENLRAALHFLLERARTYAGLRESHEQVELALRLCIALSRFWHDRGYGHEGLSFLMQALAQRAEVGAALRSRALYEAVYLADIYARNLPLEQLAEESLALYQELGDSVGMANSVYQLGSVARIRSQFVVAHTRLEEAVARFQELGDRWKQGQCYTEWARAATEQGKFELAHTLLEKSLMLYQELGDSQRLAWVRYLLARLLFVWQQDQALAQQLAELSLAHFREQNDIFYSAAPLGLLGLIHVERGDLVTARLLLEESRAIDKKFGTETEDVHLTIGLARLMALGGDEVSARRLYQEGLTSLFEFNVYKENIAACLEGLAALEAAQGETRQAARLWGAAEALREAIDAAMHPVNRANYEQAVALAHTKLDKQAFHTAWSEGRMMTPEQVLAAQGKAMIPTQMPARAVPTPPMKLSTFPAGLTAREVDVLRLIAKGWTDAQIAEHLVISPRTVNKHTTTIYSKLGVSSRAAATRYAIEHHLL
jgi:predicted ATPase/DNA-binding CsgD family transcriptional regulator